MQDQCPVRETSRGPVARMMDIDTAPDENEEEVEAYRPPVDPKRLIRRESTSSRKQPLWCAALADHDHTETRRDMTCASKHTIPRRWRVRRLPPQVDPAPPLAALPRHRCPNPHPAAVVAHSEEGREHMRAGAFGERDPAQ